MDIDYQIYQSSVGYLVLLLVSVGLTLLANYLIQQSIRTKSPIRDDKPTTLSIRGSFIPFVVGKRRVGPIFAWAGDREIKTEKSSGGKGSGKDIETKIYFESGWHVICTGPATGLHRIWESGAIIFEGLITPITHPSGSTVNLGKHGSFDIFWGEQDQPINTYLGHFDRVAVHSRWPFICYVVWRRKKLGVASQWPLIDYEIEFRPIETSFITSQPWITNGVIEGANIGHVIEQIMFSKFPHGIGKNKDDFNIDSLRLIAELMQTGDDFLPCHLFVQDGEDFRSILFRIMEEIGMMLVYNNETGKIDFKLIRKPQVPVKQITQELIISPKPRIETVHDEKFVDKVLVAFSDIDRSYRDSTVAASDDGSALLTDGQKGKKIQASLVTDFDSAAKILLRKEQENIFEGSAISIKSNRATRTIHPGDPLFLEGNPNALRVVETEVQPLSSDVKIECLIDTYAVNPNTSQVSPGFGLDPVSSPIQPDSVFTFLELPPYLSEKIEIIVLRTRSNQSVSDAALWISNDNITYHNIGKSLISNAAGSLNESISSSGPSFIDSGPLVNIIGFDISAVEDLSGDPLNWRGGRQICLINEEVFFLRNIVLINSGQFRLNGLIRARYGGLQLAHNIGDTVFIFKMSSMQRFSDVLIAVNKTVYLKTQPIGAITDVPLNDITPVSKLITGKVFRGINPRNLKTTNLLNSYRAGENVPFKWAYHSRVNEDTGAGSQNAGTAVTDSPIEGTFELKFLTTGDVLKKTVSGLTINSYTLTNADLVTSFGSEPSQFKVEITHTRAGLISSKTTILVDKD